MKKTLDLGCGLNPRNPFNAEELFGVDIRSSQNNNIKIADLAVEEIPFPSEYFDYVSAYDFLEHIPRVLYHPNRRFSFIELMNEIYRVLKMDGLFASFTPAYPKAAAFVDPTHVNYITDQTFLLYFDNKNRWGKDYGFIGSFEIIDQKWHPNGHHLQTIMKKCLVD
jgi:SAM-dependent methyltransferase